MINISKQHSIIKYKLRSNELYTLCKTAPFIYIFQITYQNQNILTNLKNQLKKWNLNLYHINQKTIHLTFKNTQVDQLFIGNTLFITPALYILQQEALDSFSSTKLTNESHLNDSVFLVMKQLKTHKYLFNLQDNQVFLILNKILEQYPSLIFIGLHYFNQWFHSTDLILLQKNTYTSNILDQCALVQTHLPFICEMPIFELLFILDTLHIK